MISAFINGIFLSLAEKMANYFLKHEKNSEK